MKKLKIRRAVVVFFDNEKILAEFRECEHFKQFEGAKADTLTGKNDNNEKTIKVSNATNQN